MRQHGNIKGTSPDRFSAGMLRVGLRSGYARLLGSHVAWAERRYYRITPHRMACRYGMNFTRVPLYLKVQRHAVVNEGILPAPQVAHSTKSNLS